NIDRFESALSSPRDAKLKRILCRISGAHIRAVDLHEIFAAVAFADAGGELGALQHAGGAGFELAQDRDPVIDIRRRSAAHGDEVAEIAGKRINRTDQV